MFFRVVLKTLKFCWCREKICTIPRDRRKQMSSCAVGFPQYQKDGMCVCVCVFIFAGNSGADVRSEGWNWGVATQPHAEIHPRDDAVRWQFPQRLGGQLSFCQHRCWHARKACSSVWTRASQGEQGNVAVKEGCSGLDTWLEWTTSECRNFAVGGSRPGRQRAD